MGNDVDVPTKITFVTPDPDEHPGLKYLLIGSDGYWSEGPDLEDAVGNYPDYAFNKAKETIAVYIVTESTFVNDETGKWNRPIGSMPPMMIAVLGGAPTGEDVLDPLGAFVEYAEDDSDADAEDAEMADVQEYVA